MCVVCVHGSGYYPYAHAYHDFTIITFVTKFPFLVFEYGHSCFLQCKHCIRGK